MKRAILKYAFLLACMLSSGLAYAQPANDACTGATTVTPNGTCVAGTTAAANDSWSSTVGCQSGSPNSHEDVWYSFVATGSNFSSTVTTSGSWSGNVEFVLASGTCAGGFTLVTSSCGASPLTVTATGLTIGTTYYFTVSNDAAGANGPFQVCTTTSSPPVNCTDNDDCASPTIISYTPNVQTCLTDCNTGASPGPDFAGNNCYDFQDETVWYQVTTGASSATMDISVTSTSLTTPYFAVFTTTNCTNFTIVNCTQGAAGSATNTVSVTANTTYLIAISDGGGLTGNFDLCVSVDNDNSACNTNDALTVSATSMGSPLTGPFQPGEIVTFCYNITNWQPGASCNYLQGIVPTFGDCWDPVSFTASGQPVTITTPLTTAGVIGACGPGPPCAWNACVGTSAGTWSWFNAGAVTYNNIVGSLPPNSPLPAGWFFLTSYSPTTNACTGDPTDPDNSYGDNSFPACNATLDWQVCFQLKARGAIACTNGQTDCSVSMKTYADGEIGVWNNLGCVVDIPAVFNSTLSCCVPPTANAGSNVSFCSTATGGLGAASAAGMTYSWTPTTGLSSAIVANPTVTLTNTSATATTYTYIVTQTETATGCSDQDTALVIVNPLPTVSVSGTLAICGGGSTTLTASGANTYTWSPSTGLSATSGTSVTANPSSTTTYTITGTSTAGCINTTTRIVTVTTITASISAKTNVLCNGGTTGTATVEATGGSGGYSYTWNTSPVQNTPTATGLAAGTYTATASNSGCSDTAVVIITQPTALTASTTFVNPSCNTSTNGTATANPLGGTGAYTYSWNTTPAQTTSTATGLGSGTYVVTVRDANGCSTTASATLTAPTAITVPTSTTNTNCGAATGTATATPSGGTGAYTFSWNTTPSQSTNPAILLAAGAYNVTVTDANGCTGTGTATVNNNGAPTVSVTSTVNVACNGGTTGSITVSVSGGTGAYTYSWNTTPVQTTATASNLPAGTYAVTVTDAANCSGTASSTVTQPATIVITPTPVSPLCNGGTGSASLSVTGGTGAYTYSWNTTPAQTTSTATNLPAGSYVVTVRDANNCSNTANVTITQPTALGLSATSTAVSCNGGVNGTATANPTGGTGTYTYSWSTAPVQTSATASGLTAGTYTVRVTDANGCFTTTTVTVNQPTAISTPMTFTAPSCNGGTNGTATVTASGGTGAFTYSWNTTPSQTTATATGLAAGAYTVQVRDANGCTVTGNVTVTQPTLLSVSASGTNPTCNGGTNGSATATVSGGTGTYTYSWNTTPSQNTATATGLGAGNYQVTVTDANGCSVAPASVTLSQPSAINLFTTVVNVACNGGTTGSATANASGGTGTLTYTWNTTPVQNTAVATGLPAGTYVVTVNDANGCTATANATITQPAVLGSSITATTNVSCNGGSNGTATVTPTGGNGTYTYSWNTTPAQTTATASGLAIGSYVVTVTDANGCQVQSTANITQPTALSATTSSTNTNCGSATGSATVTPTGGTGAYTYLWSTTPPQTTATTTSTLSAGNYNVTVTDANGCSFTTSANVNNNGAPTVNITSTTNVLCNGASTGSLTVTASGGTGTYTYSWNSTPSQATATASNLPAGNYNVTVTDGAGCSASTSGTITQPTLLDATVTPTNALCNAGTGSATSTVTGGTGAYTYSWSSSPVQTTANATALPAGAYTLVVTDANGCTDTETFNITEPLAIGVTTTTVNVSCFGGSNGSATANVTNGVGALDYSWNTTPVQISATAAGLTAGVYTVLVTDGNGCTGSANATITEPTLLTVDVPTSTNVLCNGASTGDATATANGGTGAYTYSWSTLPSQSTQTATGLAADTFYVTVTDANGCTALDSIVIAQPSAISVTDVIVNASCAGGDGSITLTATGGNGTFTYSIDNGVTTQASGVFTNLNANTYQAVVTDANNCVFTATYTVNTGGSLVATISNVTNLLCNGVCNGSATVTASGGGGNYTYSWDAPLSATTPTASSLCAGTYTVTVSEQVPAGGTCQDTAVAIITEPIAITTTSASTSATCGASNGTASVSASGGVGPYTYSWNTTPAQTNDTATGLPAGTHQVMVTDANGCTVPVNVTVTTPGGLAVSISDTTDVTCFGLSNGSATASAVGGTTPYTYEWNPGAVMNATISSVPAGTYTVTVTDATGCTSTSMAPIAQPAALVLVPNTLSPTCNGLTDGSASVSVTGGIGTYTYSWSNGVLNDTITNVGQGSYTVTVVDSNGCSSSTTANVTEPAAITFTITGTDPLCNNDLNGSAVVTNVAGGTGAYTYSWTGTGVTNDTLSNVASGLYEVVVTDANNCAATQQVTLNNPAIIAGTQSQTNVLCTGGATGSATIGSITGGNGTYSYSWNTVPVQTSATATGLTVGNYTVVVTDGNGCNSLPFNFVITEPASALSATANGQAETCPGANNGQASAIVTGGTTPYTYSWSNGSTITPVSNLAAGTYTLNVTDANGCTATDTSVVTSPATMVASGNSLQAGCGMTNGEASVTVTGGSTPYTYSWNGTANTGSTLTGVAAGTYNVTITDANGCSITTPVTVAEDPSPVAGFTTNTSTGLVPLTVLFSNTTTGASIFNWTFGNGQTDVAPNPSTVYNTEGTYQVVLTASSGNCVDTASMTITVTGKSIFAIPNVFTPDGDGINDRFEFESISKNISSIHMQIFNRWGEKIYDNEGQGISWDGRTSSGVESSPGTYYYIISAKGADNVDYPPATGFILLNRK